MRKYEFTVIFRPEEDAFSRGKEIVKTELNAQKAVITKEEDMGIRDLAYDIQKQSRGHYVYFEMDLDPSTIIHMDKIFRIKTEILKYLFVRQEI